MDVIDLFSGPGGMSAGFAQMPQHFTHLAAVDIEAGKPGLKASKGTETYCNATFKRNIGTSPLKADLSVLPPSELRQHVGLDRGELGVLISCAPCTGFSQKLPQNLIKDDPRNYLVERTGFFVEEFMPEFLIMENVKELIQGKHKHHYSRLRQRLSQLGYSIHAEVYNLAMYGLPQKRNRAIIIARRDGLPVIGLSRIVVTQTTVRDAIGHLPAIEAGQSDLNDPMHVCPSHTANTLQRMRAIPQDGGSWGDIVESHPHLLIPSMIGKRAGSYPDVYGRMWWDRPAPTITRECASPGNGRYTHPEQNRMLSVREMALLQGFPPDYYFEGTLTQKYNQIGDAVPPLISAQIAEAIVSMHQDGNINQHHPNSIREAQLST